MRNILVVIVMILFIGISAYGQVNKVLSLDGDGDYVQLPSNIFNELNEATVEGCVSWSNFNSWSRFFDFGNINHTMVVANSQTSSRLTFHLNDQDGMSYQINTQDLLQLRQKYHIAAVSGTDGMKLYLDGELVGTNPYTGSFLDTGSGENNYLGKSNWNGDADFYGQIDEVRIWNVARTQEQIQATMNTTLTGNEEGLVGYWNFDDGTANDLTANNNDGTLYGDARIVDQYYVSPSGNDANEGSKEDPFKTIQHAIDQSGRGDVITALPGTYEENITLVGDLILQGSGANQTIIAASIGNVVTASNVHNLLLSGFTIDGQGTADNGILCSGSTTEIEVRDNTITNATRGIYCKDSVELLIENNRVSQNISEGIICFNSSSPEIINNSIECNGWGISCKDNSISKIQQNYIVKNHNNGIYCNQMAKPQITHNIIEGNEGHGIGSYGESSANIVSNTIYNTSHDGIWCAGTSQPTIKENLIHNNLHNGIILHDSTNPIIIQNIIRDNNNGLAYYGTIANFKLGGSLVNANIIVNNNSYAIYNNTGLNINAQYNYWGTDDESEIENMIRNPDEGSIIFKPFIGDPELIGNVSGSGGITAYDASLILQYIVGLIDQFPANISSIGENITPRNRIISIPNLSVNTDELISLPILIDETSDLVAGGVTIKYDATVLKDAGIKVTSESLLNDTYWQSNIDNGEIRLAFTKTYLDEANQSNMLAMLEFEAIGNIEGITTDLVIDHAQIAESITIAKVDGHITFLPSKTLLLQNYPNPFNPETWIPFKLSKSANVVISIYDVEGQLIRKIGLGNTSAGMYLNKDKAVYWDGCNSSGERVSSGLYFYTLQAGSYSATKRMLILK